MRSLMLRWLGYPIRRIMIRPQRQKMIEQLAILVALRDAGELSTYDLTAAANVVPARVYANLMHLERIGYIVGKIEDPPHNGWKQRIFYRLTDKGEQAIAS